MDSAANNKSVNPKGLKVGSKTFLGIIWGGWAIAVIFVVFRILSRIKVFKRIYWDDVLVLCALAFALASAIIWQTFMAHDMYELMNVSAGLELPGPSFLADGQRYSRASLAILILFYSTLWSIKLSFLIFFKRLGKNVLRQKLIWWPVFGFTVASFVVAIGVLQFRCLVSSLSYLIEHCTTDSAIQFQRATLMCTCILDVLTDLSIMVLPIAMLWGVQIPVRRKLALGGIFSLVIITIAFAIIRTVAVTTLTRLPDTSWLYMWSAIETTVALIISCVASFRSLFSNRDTRAQPVKYIPPSSKQRFLEEKSKKRFKDPNTLTGTFANISARETSSQDSDPERSDVSADGIRVRHDIDFTHESV